MTQERFPVEIIIEKGRIVEIVPLSEEELSVDGPFASLDLLTVDEKKCKMQHGTILYSGQNSPGCISWWTPAGYTRV